LLFENAILYIRQTDINMIKNKGDIIE